MRISFKTLGCRLNQFETDALVSEFDQKGYKIVNFKEPSDITVINTCTVTGQSDHKSRNIIQQAIKSNPNSTIVVTGCMAEQYKSKIEAINGVSLVVNNKNKSGISEIVEQHLKNSPKPIKIDEFSYKPVLKSLHTRAAIKIQDGCDNMCTFCIIPQVRGRAISRPVIEIIENIKQTVANGFKELVITGVNIGRYYNDGTRFIDLIKQILEIPGDFRVRISSLEPDGFDMDFIELFDNPKLTPHLHLCLQSGSDQILLKMRRMYSVDVFKDFTDKLLKKYPNFNLTTDIIVGFPQETDKNFKETTNIVKQIGFSHVHTFKYSIRKGTAAERMPEQIDDKTKQLRSEQLRTIAEENKIKYFKTFIGKTEKVLVEKHIGNNLYMGYGQHYIPIIFKSVYNLKNQFIDVNIEGFDNESDKIRLKGRLVKHYSVLEKVMIKI